MKRRRNACTVAAMIAAVVPCTARAGPPGPRDAPAPVAVAYEGPFTGTRGKAAVTDRHRSTDAARPVPPARPSPAASTAGGPAPGALKPSGAIPAPEPPAIAASRAAQDWRWSCAAGDTACTRSKPARTWLAGVGILGAAAGLTTLLVIGDRLRIRDPAGLLIGAGGIGIVGASLGALAGWTMGDSPGSEDRIRRAAFDTELGFGDPAVAGEQHPPTGTIAWGPTYMFPNERGRMRLIGHFGGLLGDERDVDPRPQRANPEFPVGSERRALTGSVGLDLAVALPYPIVRPGRASFLGAAELRWKPEVQFRRETFQPGQDNARDVRRTMFLPATVGVRWHLSARQRFTFYIGPRWDFVAAREDGGEFQGGEALPGPMYGEAWYDIDIPHSLMRKRERRRHTQVNSLISIGYIHSRFDGRGFNIGGAIGFTGPTHIAWSTRVRAPHAPWALQGTAGMWIGNGVGPFVRLGIVLPDLEHKK